MRIASYSRVSTLGQETDGESLRNQDRAFERALERNPTWTRVAHYREAASAKTVAGRAEFSRMIAELDRTKPDMIVVDTIDRFTRNLREGLNLLEELRGRHVRLLPLDWRRPEPIDLDDDRDWQDVVGEFIAAERENRIRARRMRRSYDGRRERGAPLRNKPPFGLARDGDRWVPGPQAWVIAEVDRRYLAGETAHEILAWVRTVSDDTWSAISSVRMAMKSPHYVAAGVRTPEMAAALAARLALQTTRHGAKRKHEHEFGGVFACGRCVAAGFSPESSLMYAQMTSDHQRKGNETPALVCVGGYHAPDSGRHKRQFIVRVHKIAEAWDEMIVRLRTDDDELAAWARGGLSANAVAKRRALLSRLAAVDNDAARLKARRDRAFDLLADSDDALATQARKMLAGVHADESALAAKAEALRAQLADVGEPAARDAVAMRQGLRAYGKQYARASIRQRNLLNRQLVAALGAYPQIDRDVDHRYGIVRVTWPGVLDRASTTHR